MNEMILWLFLAYVAGSLVTWYLVWKHNSITTINLTIDSLIDQGYLRSRIDNNGEVVLLKYNEE